MPTPLIFLVVGFLILYLGVTGRLGVFLAAIFIPGQVKVNG